MARDMSRESNITLSLFKFEMVEMAEMAGMVEMATSICPFAGARYTLPGHQIAFNLSPTPNKCNTLEQPQRNLWSTQHLTHRTVV